MIVIVAVGVRLLTRVDMGSCCLTLEECRCLSWDLVSGST